MSRFVFLGILLAFYLIIDIYSFNGLKSTFQGNKYFTIVYWAISVLVFLGIYQTFQFLQTHTGIRPLWLNLTIGSVFTVFVTKFIFGGMLMIYDVTRLLIGLFQYGSTLVSSATVDGTFIPKRRRLVTGIITGIAAIPFLGMLHGITRGKYNYEIKKVQLAFKDLPKSFEGFKLVQISDIHSGSYDSYNQVMKGINMINGLEPDVLVFTGDLVNSSKNEIDPYISAFKAAESKEGKFSITGNHDYYGIRRSEDKDEYWADFLSKHDQMGFDLLLNENRVITRGDESIRLVGVENWGKGPFPRHGDLNKALTEVASDEFTVLLSHDPTHWDEHALKHEKHIHLTLSGHTHGMQFGLNALGIKWSPIKYRYKKWAGLYTEMEQHLYVNRGFGFLGLPGRIGMWPEITEFEFVRAEA